MRKLSLSGGLQELVIIGLGHPPTLAKFQNGLLKSGGKLRVVY